MVDGSAENTKLPEGMCKGTSKQAFFLSTLVIHCLTLLTTLTFLLALLDDGVCIMLIKKGVDLVSNNIRLVLQKQLT